jgi:DNA-binding HxlR family transcriptional regulator
MTRQQAMKLLAYKWTGRIIHVLAGGTLRNTELLRRVQGISQKMLTQTLRQLEHHGLVARKTHPVVPPMVEYSLTPLGQTLVEPLGALARWATAHASGDEAVLAMPESRAIAPAAGIPRSASR